MQLLTAADLSSSHLSLVSISVVVSRHNPTLGGMSADSLMTINPSDLHKQANFLPLTVLRTITKHILASRRPN